MAIGHCWPCAWVLSDQCGKPPDPPAEDIWITGNPVYFVADADEENIRVNE